MTKDKLANIGCSIAIVIAIVSACSFWYIDDKKTKEKERARVEHIKRKTEAITNDVRHLISTTNANDEWISKLQKFDDKNKLLTSELEGLWIGDRPILFYSELNDVKSFDYDNYTIEIKSTDSFGSELGSMFDNLELSLNCPKTKIDSFLKKYPLLKEKYGNASFVVVASIDNIEDIRKREDEDNFVEKKIGIGSCVDMAYIGDLDELIYTGGFKFVVGSNKISRDTETKGSNVYQIEQVYDGLAVPYDLAVDPNGLLYIVDDKEEQVIRYDPANEHVSLVGNGLQLGFPTGIDIAGDKLYVTDFAGKSSFLYIMHTDGQMLSRIQAIPDSSAGQLRKPKAVAVDANGQVWVADRSNNRLVQFDLLGKYIRAINLSDQFRSPNGLAFGPSPQRDIFVTLKDTNQLIRVTRDGRLQNVEIHTGDRIPVEFSLPAGVAVDSSGFMYIADRDNSRLIIANPIRKVIATIDKSRFADFDSYSPFGLKISPDEKYLYITGSTHASFDDICGAGRCKGKIWRMWIGG